MIHKDSFYGLLHLEELACEAHRPVIESPFTMMDARSEETPSWLERQDISSLRTQSLGRLSEGLNENTFDHRLVNGSNREY